MTTNQPPLTAEDIAKKIVGDWGYEEPYWWEPITQSLEAYASQQTQALQQRVDSLEKEIENMAKQQDDMLDDWTKSEDTNAALQTKLDDAQAQVAMLVDMLKPIANKDQKDNDTLFGFGQQALASAILNWLKNQTQPNAEQWLAGRDAKLLKPLVELIEGLFMEIDNEKAAVELRKQYEALKATEGLAQ